MINVIIGAKGSGKTKYMVDHVNMAVKDEPGTLVFVSKDNRLMLDLKSAVRYINTEEFAVDDYNVLYGFLGGIISNNYDVSHIFIDSIWKVVNTAKAVFNVDDYFNFISTQADASIRQVARLYPYDVSEEGDEKSLRGSSVEIAENLKNNM